MRCETASEEHGPIECRSASGSSGPNYAALSMLKAGEADWGPFAEAPGRLQVALVKAAGAQTNPPQTQHSALRPSRPVPARV